MKKRILVIEHKGNPGFYDIYLDKVWFSLWTFSFWTNIEGRLDLTKTEALFYQLELMKHHDLSTLDIIEE